MGTISSVDVCLGGWCRMDRPQPRVKGSRRSLSGCWGIGMAILAAACSSAAPTLDAIVPSTGYPRQLLAVDGATLFAGVVWDVGMSTETVLYSGLFGTSYFQIPPTASAGSHDVAIRNSNGTSTTFKVNVLAPTDFRDDPTGQTPYFPPPRIEDIGILVISGTTSMDLILTVAAANLDVEGKITVDEIVDNPETPINEGPPQSRSVVHSSRWGGLPIDYLQHHQPSTFGYPVYHYSQFLAVVVGVTPGATIEVTVSNTDAKTDSEKYRVPNDPSQVDGDGDGLFDSWEEGSYTAQPSGNQVPLASMGVHRWRKDVLVEVDWTSKAKPDALVWGVVSQSFADAPVLNPDGSRGVNLIIDRGQGGVFSGGGQTLPEHDCLTLDELAPAGNAATACPTVTSFFSYKGTPTTFNPDRLRLFHYVIFGNRDVDNRTGLGERYGNDFYVTIGSLPIQILPTIQSFTLLHELGHNLGFSHGDLLAEDQNYHNKPNLPSVTGYRYMPLFPGPCGLIGNGIMTYSQGTLISIVESQVNEPAGLCDGVPAELNLDWDTNDVGAVNINAPLGPIVEYGEDNDTDDTWDDFDQWGSLLLDFTAKGSNWHDN